MKGLSLSEFYNALYYGADIDFEYHSKFYHVDAGIDENGNHSIDMCVHDNHPDERTYFGYKELYHDCKKQVTEAVECFLNAKLFNGKSIYEISDEIIVLYS